MEQFGVPLDQLILDMHELEALLSRVRGALADLQPEALPSERLGIQLIDLLCRVEESSETLNQLAHGEWKRLLAALLAATDRHSDVAALSASEVKEYAE